MKRYMLRNKVKIILLIIAVLLVSYFVVSYAIRQKMTISIDRESVSYIKISYHGFGWKTVNYSEHKDALDSLFDMLSGEYEYIGNWRMPEASGTGTGAIEVYNQNRELVNSILYLDYRILVSKNPSNKRNRAFYTYRNIHGTLDFNDFYSYIDKIEWSR